MSLIELRNVTKTFTSGAESVTPVAGLDFDVEAGEFVCLMGPSGSGKTTLLHMLAGIDRPTDGSVVVNGERVHELAPSQLAKWRTRAVGYVFQRSHPRCHSQDGTSAVKRVTGGGKGAGAHLNRSLYAPQNRYPSGSQRYLRRVNQPHRMRPRLRPCAVLRRGLYCVRDRHP